MSAPELPLYLENHGMTDSEVEDLWGQLVAELLVIRFNTRKHGSRSTYDSGCTGPLCSKAQREYGRRRQKTGISEKYRYIDEMLNFWEPIAVNMINEAQSRIYEQMTS